MVSRFLVRQKSVFWGSNSRSSRPSKGGKIEAAEETGGEGVGAIQGGNERIGGEKVQVCRLVLAYTALESEGPVRVTEGELA